MSQSLSAAAGPDGLVNWAAAFSQSKETNPETVIPTHVIFNVAAYPFGKMECSLNSGVFSANGMPVKTMTGAVVRLDGNAP
jgi:hypothetical protein